MKKYFNIFVKCLLCVLAVLCLVACGETEDKKDDKKDEKKDEPVEIDWDSKTILTVEFDAESFGATYDVDDFKVSLLQLHIIYTDGTERNIPCTKDMFDDNDYKKLSSPGSKKVTVTYDAGDFSEETKVNLIDYAVADMNLNRNNVYNAVFKIIRNQRNNKLDFIVDPKDGFAGVQVKYTFEKGKINLSNFKVNEAVNGYGSFVFDADAATLTITFVTNANITEETTLFSCDWEGDFRFSGLKADETFANKIYSLVEREEGITTEMMLSVLFHVSQK